MKVCSICCNVLNKGRWTSVTCYCNMWLPVCDICASSINLKMNEDRKEFLRRYCLHKSVSLI